jgi:hypothetical protein
MFQQSSQLPYENNVDKVPHTYKGRKLSLDAAEALQLRYEEELGPTIIAFRPGYQRVSAYHVLGKQTAGVVTGNAGIVLTIAEPAGGNYA